MNVDLPLILGPVINNVLVFSFIIQSLATYPFLLTTSTTGCLPSLIIISCLSVNTGFTKLYSSAHTASDNIASNSLSISASRFNSNIFFLTVSLISINN